MNEVDRTRATRLPRLGKYRVLGEIGRGGMGIVYLAEDPVLERRIAIKALPQDLSLEPQRRARFERASGGWRAGRSGER